MVAQQFAADHPDAVPAMIILDADLNTTAIRLIGTAATRISAWVMRLAALLLGDARSLGLYQPILTRASYSKAWRRAHPDRLEQAGREFKLNTLNGLVWNLLAYAARPDLTQALAKVRSRTLLIRGSNDIIMTQGKMEALARAIPDSRLLVVEGSGHMTIAEQPETVVGMIDSFLQETAAGLGGGPEST
jgi:pimeloyl-ACP methyl ester carboxylesterase